MVKGAILLVEKLPDEVSIETVRSAFSEFGDVKWVDIHKTAAQVCIISSVTLPVAFAYFHKVYFFKMLLFNPLTPTVAIWLQL